MKIAIHHKENSFSERWIEYCKINNIDFTIVNVYSSDIINQINGCDAFLWHFEQEDYRDMLFAKQLLNSLQSKGIRVFPDNNTCWHFDDKVGQKYLLEAVNAPLVPSYVFYNKKDAINWIEITSFPKVFKLRGGAGSKNVELVRTKKMAIHLARRAFNKGFSQTNKIGYTKERLRLLKEGNNKLNNFLKAIGIWFVPAKYNNHKMFEKMRGNEKGYLYFQEFISNLTFDIRIIVIGNKAFGLKRMVRANDFRASGSGHIIYDKEQIDERCVKIAFDVNEKLKTQCVGFDFIIDKNNIPLIVECSYGFAVKAYDKCQGYWDNNLVWHNEQFNPQFWQIQNLLLC